MLDLGAVESAPDAIDMPPSVAEDNALDAPSVAALCAQVGLLRDLVAVDFSALCLGSQQLAALAQQLAHHPQLTCLILGVGDAAITGTRALADALPRWPRLQHFEATDACWSWSDDGTGALAAALLQGVQALTALTWLQLASIDSGNGAFGAISSLQELRHLNLTNGMDEDCVHRDAGCSVPLSMAAVQRLQHLTELDVSGRVWQGDALPFPASLQTLRLTHSVAIGTNVDLTNLSQNLSQLFIDGLLIGQLEGSCVVNSEVHVPSGVHELTQLTRLVFGDCPLEDDRSIDTWSAQLCAAVSRLTRLRNLCVPALGACDHLTRAMAPVWHCLPELHALFFQIGADSALLEVSEGVAATNAVAATVQVPMPALQHLKLWMWVKQEAGVVTFDARWIAAQILRLTTLRSLSLSTSLGEERTLVYCDELIWGVAALSHLQNLQLHGADLGECELVVEVPHTLPELTLLELEECTVPNEFAENLNLGKLVRLTLDACSAVDQRVNPVLAFAASSRSLPASLQVLKFENMDSFVGHEGEALASFFVVIGSSQVQQVSLEGTKCISCLVPSHTLSAEAENFNRQHIGKKHCIFSFEVAEEGESL